MQFNSKLKTQTNNLTLLKNRTGQGLVEYLIIVSIVAVGAIGIVKVISQNMRFHFTQVAESLGSHAPERPQKGEIRKTHFESKDFSNFWEGSK
jgi:pilus assembly protein Flp/PilA